MADLLEGLHETGAKFSLTVQTLVLQRPLRAKGHAGLKAAAGSAGEMSVDLRITRPLQGWRMFFGEVGVIVLGVLLALGAQQVVQDLQMRSDVNAFRKTIDHEIALNLYVYDVRTSQTSCIERKLKELDSWLDMARNGSAAPPLRAERPVGLSAYRSAWDNRNANVFANLPHKTRQKYAECYDELTNNNYQLALEADTWRALYPYAEPGPISLEDRRKIRSTLGIAGSLDDTSARIWTYPPLSSRKTAR